MKVGCLVLEGSKGKGGGRCKYCFPCITLQFLRPQRQFVSNPLDAEISQSKIARARRASAILLVFEKIYSCLFIPNCTRNHVITYTKNNKADVFLSLLH